MGQERVVELLLRNGARPDFADGDGQTPQSRADNAAIVQLLNSYCTP
jgi:hypothetical protein